MPPWNRFSVSRRNFGLVPIGYQASPSQAVRRNAGPLSPPTQIGTRFCTGRGWKKMFEKFAYLPLKRGFSSVHSTRQAAIVSSVTAPRSSNGSRPHPPQSFLPPPPPLPPAPADPDAPGQPAFRQDVDRRQDFRGQHRRAMRHDRDRGDEAQFRRLGRDKH